MNKIILLGRLTDEPELRYTPTGKVVAQFRIAVNRPFTNQDGQREADFISCILWGKQAEALHKSLHKGHRILIEGRLQTRNYTAKDGTKRYITEVIGDRFEYIEKREQSEYAPGVPQQQRQTSNYYNQPPSTNYNQRPNEADFGTFGTAFNPNDEIPF